MNLSTWAVTTYCGSVAVGGLGGSCAGGAKFSGPYGLDVAPGAQWLAVGDSLNHRVRRIDLTTRLVTTVAGSSLQGESLCFVSFFVLVFDFSYFGFVLLDEHNSFCVLRTSLAFFKKTFFLLVFVCLVAFFLSCMCVIVGLLFVGNGCCFSQQRCFHHLSISFLLVFACSSSCVPVVYSSPSSKVQ